MIKDIELPATTRRDATHLLQKWLAEEFGEEVGALQAEMLLDQFARNIGPLFYNQGLKDAQDIFAAKAEDVADALYGLERQSPLR